jgi:hypothetical protein
LEDTHRTVPGQAAPVDFITVTIVLDACVGVVRLRLNELVSGRGR